MNGDDQSVVAQLAVPNAPQPMLAVAPDETSAAVPSAEPLGAVVVADSETVAGVFAVSDARPDTIANLALPSGQVFRITAWALAIEVAMY